METDPEDIFRGTLLRGDGSESVLSKKKYMMGIARFPFCLCVSSLNDGYDLVLE